MIMDDNFSPRVKDVISFSKEEALRLGHDFIGTEHFILGIIRVGNVKEYAILEILVVEMYYLSKKVDELCPYNENVLVNNDKKNLHLTRQADSALKMSLL